MLILPCTHIALLDQVVAPALRHLPSRMTSPAALVAELAIAGQESNLEVRLQRPNGPAHSLWQFERGGIRGVLDHPLTHDYALQVCDALNVPATVDAVYAAMLEDDELGACFARLNLWWSAGPIPTTEDALYAYYLAIWRPGAPDKTRWAPHYAAAVDAVGV